MRAANFAIVLLAGMLLLAPAMGLAVNLSLSWRTLAAAIVEHSNQQAVLVNLPRELDEFVGDNFGWRRTMIRSNAEGRAMLGAGSFSVAIGTEGYLFLTDNYVFGQVTGQKLDAAGLRKFAGLAAGLYEESLRNGRVFLAMVAPNKHGIYRRYLPRWARQEPPAREIDLAYEMLVERGIPALDVRKALLARVEHDPVYWHGDTHWTPLGALIAFNEIVRAIGYGHQAVDIDSVYRGHEGTARTGDLVRLGGLSEQRRDIAPRLIGPNPASTEGLGHKITENDESLASLRVLSQSCVNRKKFAPKVLILGDSFTWVDFPQLFSRFACETLWVSLNVGHFDRSVLTRFDPDVVILATVERHLSFFRDWTD